MRALTDEFDARMMVGEVGDAGETGIRIMGEYTEGNDLVHMCYNFEMLGPAFSAKHFRAVIETSRTERRRVGRPGVFQITMFVVT